MTRNFPSSRSRRPLAAAGGVALLLAAGWIAGSAAPSSAASLDDCLLLPDLCPTLPSLPTLPLPTVPTTPTVPAVPDPLAADQPASSGGAPAEAAGTAATGGAGAAPQGSFSYKLVRASARRSGARRRIELRLSLSQPATVVAVLHRRTVPMIVAVKIGRTGTNRFTIAVPKRVRRGSYGLQLRLATHSGTKTVNRRLAIPR